MKKGVEKKSGDNRGDEKGRGGAARLITDILTENVYNLGICITD